VQVHNIINMSKVYRKNYMNARKGQVAGNSRHDPVITERRHFMRHPVCFPLAYKVLDNSPVHEKEKRSTTINISMGGLLFSAKHPAKVKSKILIKMPFQDKVFNIKARVVHCNINPDTKMYNIGACFYRVSDAFKTKLIEQLYLISEFRDVWSMQLGRQVTLEEASREWIKRYSERFRRLYW